MESAAAFISEHGLDDRVRHLVKVDDVMQIRRTAKFGDGELRKPGSSMVN
jgi:hypothetical protein